MLPYSYQILNESIANTAMKDKLLAHLKLPMAKLQQTRAIDKSSVDEAGRMVGKNNANKSIQELGDIYKGALRDAKLTVERDTVQVIGAFKATKRSLIIFKYEYVVFQLIQAVKSKMGHTLWLVCRVVWIKEPGEKDYSRAGGFAVLFDR